MLFRNCAETAIRMTRFSNLEKNSIAEPNEYAPELLAHRPLENAIFKDYIFWNKRTASGAL